MPFLLFLNFTKQVGKATADLEIVRICCDPNKGDPRHHLNGSAKTALTHNGPLSLYLLPVFCPICRFWVHFSTRIPSRKRRFADQSFSPQIDGKPQRKDPMDATRSLQWGLVKMSISTRFLLILFNECLMVWKYDVWCHGGDQFGSAWVEGTCILGHVLRSTNVEIWAVVADQNNGDRSIKPRPLSTSVTVL